MEQLDLTKTDSNVGGGVQQIQYVPYNPDRHRALAQAGLAYSLLFVIFVVILFLFIAWMIFNKDIQEIQTMSELSLIPLFGLVGFVMGFYFGYGK
jgi:NADH:ubiquinone oxidoreductase subunit 3 (subunit A)